MSDDDVTEVVGLIEDTDPRDVRLSLKDKLPKKFNNEINLTHNKMEEYDGNMATALPNSAIRII